MVSKDRWDDAQSYEKKFWESVAQEAARGNPEGVDYYQWRAGELIKWLNSLDLAELTDGSARVLEIGCGPVGIAGFLPSAEQVALDPLEPFYASRPELVADRPASVSYRVGSGEAIPAEDGYFRLAILENCIDHCHDMDAVMSEVRRVLASDGFLYLSVNSRSPLGYPVHRVLSRLRLDPGHPHTFTLGRTRRFIESHGFDIVGLKRESWFDAWRQDLGGPTVKQRLKGLLGVSEFLVSVIAQLRR